MIKNITTSLRGSLGALQGRSDRFLDSLAPRFSRRALSVASLLFLLAFSGFGVLTPNALENGDAAVYAQQIADREFSTRTIHIGYFLLGSLFTYPLSRLSIPLDHALNLMNCVCGALSVMLIYVIALRAARKQWPAVAAAVFLATNSVFVFNALYAEIYAPATFFVLLACVLWLRTSPMTAGISLGIAGLITPSSVFAAPLFPFLRPRMRPLLRFAAAALVVIVLGLCWHVRDFLSGQRGLLKAVGQGLPLHHAILKEGRELFLGLFVYIPFVICGIVVVVKTKRLHPLGVALAGLWIANFLFGERFSDVPVQLSTWALLCVLGGVGVDMFSRFSPSSVGGAGFWIPIAATTVIGTAAVVVRGIVRSDPNLAARMSRYLPPTEALVAFGFATLLYAVAAVVLKTCTRLSAVGRSSVVIGTVLAMVITGTCFALGSVARTNAEILAYRNAALRMGETASPDFLLLADWDKGILLEHYLFRRSYTGRWICTTHLFGLYQDLQRQTETWEDLRKGLRAGREIWVVREGRTLVSPRMDKLVKQGFKHLFSELRGAGYVVELSGPFHRARPKTVQPRANGPCAGFETRSPT